MSFPVQTGHMAPAGRETISRVIRSAVAVLAASVVLLSVANAAAAHHDAARIRSASGHVPARWKPMPPAFSLGARLQVCPPGGCEIPTNASPLAPSRGIALSLRMAARWWTLAPACGTVTFWLADLPAEGEVGVADDDLCRIYIDRAFWSADWRDPFAGNAADPFTLCVVISHEYGHLLGYQHNAEQDSIMAPVGGHALPLPCVRRWPSLATDGAVLSHPR